MDIRDDARNRFTEFFGQPPAGLWSAPGVLTFAGVPGSGHTLSIAISRRTVIAAGGREDRMLRVASSYADEVAEIDLALLAPERLHGWSAYPLSVAWALGELGADLGAVPGVDLFIESDIPVGTGLSSSAALIGAVALALNDVWRLGLTTDALARAGQHAEGAVTSTPVLIVGTTVSLIGRAGSAVLLDESGAQPEHINLGLEQSGLALLVIDTGAAVSGPRAGLDESERVLAIAHALREGEPIGRLLDDSHQALRGTPEFDLAVDVAVASGAVGVRMIGGSSGAAFVLLPAASVSLVQVALDGAFSEHGYSPPDTFVVVPSGGATREP